MPDALPLFGEPDPPCQPPGRESAQRSLTSRQGELLTAGRHPLTLILSRPLHLHLEAAPHDDRTAPGRRCGNCIHRQKSGWGFPKCGIDGRASRGVATDCRAWWPACRDHEWSPPA